jgi:hypothetical protein
VPAAAFCHRNVLLLAVATSSIDRLLGPNQTSSGSDLITGISNPILMRRTGEDGPEKGPKIVFPSRTGSLKSRF